MNIWGLKKKKQEASKRWTDLKNNRKWDEAKRVADKVKRLNREIELKRQQHKKEKKK